MPYLSRIEWEGIKDKIDIKIAPHGYSIEGKFLPDNLIKMEIWRDNEYNIVGRFTGRVNDINTLKGIGLYTSSPVNIPLNFKIIHKSFENYIEEYSLEECYINKRILFEDTYELEFNISSLSIFEGDIKETPEIAWLTEWYLNGSKEHIYSRTTSREIKKNYKRDRKSIGNNSVLFKENKDVNEHKYAHFNGNCKGSVSKDYIFVEYQLESGEERYFIIHSVPKKYGPSWSNNIGIEYNTDWGIPKAEERKKISEIVGFMIGRQLINVGYSEFDKEGEPVKEVSLSPNLPSETSIIDLCQKYDIYPVDYGSGIPQRLPYNGIESDFSKLIPVYINLRDDLNLHEVLGRYWLSYTLPKDAEIVLLAAGLELLFNSWYKSNKTKSKGFYLPKKEFDKMLSNEFNLIAEKLAKIDFGENDDFNDRILRRIKNTFQMSFNERVHFFFKRLDLNIGEIEEKAIISRNNPAHGNIIKSDDREKLIRYTNAYRTLFNRTMLKILDFDGKYIDYYNPQNPKRHINDPIK